jgi:tight adherence protein C
LIVLQTTGRITTIPWTIIIRNATGIGAIGYIIPRIWLRWLLDRRQSEIIFSFSDALDLLSISVEAGLGFDSAMVRVSEQWDNALTREFSRAVREMRIGTPRNVALQRMADRTGVQEVKTFVGVLIQSSELGVSIAEVLHVQAEEVRLRRRQRAEELGRQASIKMIFALVFLIFPALLVVLLGPGIPSIFRALGSMTGG